MISLNAGNKIITTQRPSFIMGILNVTPDSFYKESRGFVERALQLIDEGADILDIGAESTRPGFTEVPVDEEISRLIPVLSEIRKHSDIPISIDTRKAKVLQEAVKYNINFFNDVSCFEYDYDSLKIARDNNLSVIIMNDKNGNTKQTRKYLKSKIKFAIKNGIKKEKIILDPGIGFNKSFEENIDLIKSGSKIGKNYPVLMALSRKRCIGQMTNTEVEDRLAGTLTANIISIINGVKIVRVHDVKETLYSLDVLKTILS